MIWRHINPKGEPTIDVDEDGIVLMVYPAAVGWKVGSRCSEMHLKGDGDEWIFVNKEDLFDELYKKMTQ